MARDQWIIWKELYRAEAAMFEGPAFKTDEKMRFKRI